MAAVDPCHNPSLGSYDTCLKEGFEISVTGIPTIVEFHILLAGTAGAIALLAAAWMLSEIYNSWASKKLGFKYLINTPIRVIIITTVIMYLVFNT